MQSQLPVSPALSAGNNGNKMPLQNFNIESPLDGKIKALRAGHGSKIPSPPTAEISSTPPSSKKPATECDMSPMMTPSSCTRKETLKQMEEQLESRLSAERRIQAKLLTQLDCMVDMTTQEAKNVKQDADNRAQRVFTLSQKLTKTRHTLASLESAQAEYHCTAKQVEAAEAKLARVGKENAPRISRPTRRMGLSDPATIRKELDQATSMMSAAFKRVEQIEGITDGLIEQLMETEAELTEIQSLRQKETKAHEAELDRLNDLLSDAERKRSQGTPVGNGAKIVLPMALERIRETQAALQEQQQSVALAQKELQKTKEEASKKESELLCKVQEIDDERCRQLAEKQASLESMTRAAAAATKEAALKQESIMKMTDEIKLLQEQKTKIMNDLEKSISKSSALEAELNDLDSAFRKQKIQMETVTTEADGLRAEIEQTVCEREQLQIALDQLKEKNNNLEKSVKETNESLLKIEKEVEIAISERDTARIQVEQIKEKLDSMSNDYRIVQQKCQDSKEEIETKDKAIMEMEISLTNSKAEFENLMDEKLLAETKLQEEKMQLRSKIEALEKELKDTNMEQLQAKQSYETLKKQLERTEEMIEITKNKLSEAQAQHLARAGELAAAIEERDAHISALKAQLSEASASQESLLSSQTRLSGKLQERERLIQELKSDLDSRNKSIASLEAHVESLVASQTEKFNGWDAQLKKATEERSKIESECSVLKNTIAGLSKSLEQKTKELQNEEKKKDASNKTLNLSFVKIKGLEATMVELQKSLELKEIRIQEQDAEIEIISKKLKENENGLKEIQSKAQASMDAAHSEYENLRREIKEKDKNLKRIKKENDEMKPQIDALHSELATAATRESSLRALLEDTTIASENKIASLDSKFRSSIKEKENSIEEALGRLRLAVQERDELAAEKFDMAKQIAELSSELHATKSNSEKKDMTRQEVINRSFDKIRFLQAQIIEKNSELSHVDARLQCAEDIAEQLAEDLAKKTTEVSNLKLDNEELKSIVCRLRLDMLQEVEKVEKANSEIKELQENLTRSQNEMAKTSGLKAISEAKSMAIKTLQARIAELEGEVMDIRSDKGEAVSNLTKQISLLETKKMEQEQIIAATIAQRDIAYHNLVEMKQKLEGTQEALKNKDMTINDLSESLISLERLVDRMKKDVAVRQQEFSELAGSYKERTKKLENDHLEALQTIEDQKNQLNQANNKLSKESARLEMLERAGIEMRTIIEEMHRSNRLRSTASVEKIGQEGNSSTESKSEKKLNGPIGMLAAAAMIGAMIHTAQKVQ